MLLPKDSLFYGHRLINHEAEEFITGKAIFIHNDDPILFKIYIPKTETGNNEKMVAAIHQHFSIRNSL
jgi:hypothetical protein